MFFDQKSKSVGMSEAGFGFSGAFLVFSLGASSSVLRMTSLGVNLISTSFFEVSS